MRRGFHSPLWATFVAISGASALLLTGCGGGGGNTGTTSSLSSATSRAALNVYVTDGFSQNYKQVITTLYKIELTTGDGNYTTVFENADGQTLDLSSLADTALLVSSLQVESGTYTQARITFADHFTLVSPGGGTSESVAVDSSVGTQSNGQVAVIVDTPVKAQAATTATLLVDFKLADFELTGGKVKPKLALGGEAECTGKNRRGTLTGTVANLTDTGFDLTGPNGHTLTVTLSDSTVIIDSSTGATGTLAAGQTVEVQGTPDASTKTLAAASITTNVTVAPKKQGADGTIASIGTDGASFVLTVERAGGGLKLEKGGTITVQTASTTKFLAGRKQTGAFTDLVVGGEVHVGGTYDAATQTLTATTVGLHPGEPASGGNTDNHPRPHDDAPHDTQIAQNAR